VNAVSIGSTPTMAVAEDLRGITEVRPGNYVFFDAHQAAIGACSLNDAAFTVLATVIGQYPQHNTVLLDAGAIALSKDEGPRHVDPECGYGAFFSAEGQHRLPNLRLTTLSQEHGVVRGTSPLDFAAFPIGRKLRIVPNHSCLAAAQYERYHVVRGTDVVDEWRPVRGW
jgi:D-serine deaminase-like pyridoxal phosphate-dependent protein